MKKQILETFIEKYNLRGEVEATILVIDSKNTLLSTLTTTPEKCVLVGVKYNKFDAITSDCNIGIHNTSKLKSMLGVLGEDVTIEPNKKADGTIISLTFNDTSTDVHFVTADLSVIPKTPTINKLPPFNAEIELTQDFISKFLKAKAALSDIDTFTVTMNKKNALELFIGNTSTNSNRIKLNVKPVIGKDTVGKSINFSAKYLKEILNANSECTDAILQISDAGLASVRFVSGDFESTYYLVELKGE